MTPNTATPLNLVLIIEHLRTTAREQANWTETSAKIGIDMQRYRYFARTHGAMPSTVEIDKMIAYFMPGCVIVPAAMIAPALVAA